MKTIGLLVFLLLNLNPSKENIVSRSISWSYCGKNIWDFNEVNQEITLSKNETCNHIYSTLLSSDGSIQFVTKDTTTVLSGIYLRETKTKWEIKNNTLVVYHPSIGSLEYQILTKEDSSMVIIKK